MHNRPPPIMNLSPLRRERSTTELTPGQRADVQMWRICTTCQKVKPEQEFSLSELDCIECVSGNTDLISPSRVPRVVIEGTKESPERWTAATENLQRADSAQRLELFRKLESHERSNQKTPTLTPTPSPFSYGLGGVTPIASPDSLKPIALSALRQTTPKHAALPPPIRNFASLSLESLGEVYLDTPIASPGSRHPGLTPDSTNRNLHSPDARRHVHPPSKFPFSLAEVQELFQRLEVAWENLGGIPLALRDLVMQLNAVPLVKASEDMERQMCRYCSKKKGTYISRVSYLFSATDTSWTCTDCYNAGLVYHSELPADDKERLFFTNIIMYCFKKAVADHTMLLEFLDFIPFVYECHIRLKSDSFSAKVKETYRKHCRSGAGLTFEELTDCFAELPLVTKRSLFRLFADASGRLHLHGFGKLLYASLKPQSRHLARMPLAQKASLCSLPPTSKPPVEPLALKNEDIPDFDYRRAKKLRVLGVGGMSIVWLMEYRGVNAAAKTPKPGTKPEHVALMFKAARIQQRVKHPNVLRVLGVYENVEWPCILLEVIDGGSIADLCLSPIPMPLKWKLATELAQGLDALHTTRPPILHRDLKGSNVFLTSDNTVKIADFDFALELEPGKKVSGACGTPGFMAPELLLGGKYDLAADVFSFGSVLYELMEEIFPFTREVDFRREDLNQGDWDKIATMLTMEGMRPSLSAKCPRDMRTLIRECWAVNPDERPKPGTLRSRLRAMPVPKA